MRWFYQQRWPTVKPETGLRVCSYIHIKTAWLDIHVLISRFFFKLKHSIQATNLGPIHELKITGFLGLVSSRWTFIVRSQASVYIEVRKDRHTSKQKVYNWPSNKSDLRSHHDRLASSHAIRINSGPRITTTARPPWYTCHRPPTDLWCFATD